MRTCNILIQLKDSLMTCCFAFSVMIGSSYNYDACLFLSGEFWRCVDSDKRLRNASCCVPVVYHLNSSSVQLVNLFFNLRKTSQITRYIPHTNGAQQQKTTASKSFCPLVSFDGVVVLSTNHGGTLREREK